MTKQELRNKLYCWLTDNGFDTEIPEERHKFIKRVFFDYEEIIKKELPKPAKAYFYKKPKGFIPRETRVWRADDEK